MNRGLLRIMCAVSILISTSATAKTYYFSTSTGDDSRTSLQAQNPVTPWKTLNKLSSFFANLVPGDSILFNRGEVFYGSIEGKRIGKMTMPIVVSSYGQGANAVICGLSTLQGWDNLAGGIDQGKLANYDLTNCVLIIDGIQHAMGRFPNSGYLTYEKHSGNKAIVDYQLSSTTNWTNAEVVIRKNRWIIDKSLILSHNGNTINYGASSSDEPTDGFGYFIQNDRKTLDAFGEWYIDTAQKKMQVYFGSENPYSHNVQIPVIRNLVDLNECSNIIFENLSFAGAMTNAFQIISSQNIAIKNCQIDISRNSITASNSKSLYIFKTIVNHSLNNAITADGSCSGLVVKECTIKNTGLLEGMGANGTGSYQAITCFGENSLIEYNTVDSTGYDAIYFGGNNSVVKHNFISNFCLTKDDGAGVYVGDWYPWVGKKIVGNIIINGKGSGSSTNDPNYLPVEGVYVDDRTSNVEIVGNTVANCPEAGIKIHNAHEIQIRANVLFNNGTQLLLAHDNIAPTSYVRNIQAFGNIYFSRSANQLCLRVYSTDNDDVSSIGVMDSNYYCRPVDESKSIQTTSSIWTANSITKNFSLSGWQSQYNMDLNSGITSISATDTNSIFFRYNPANVPNTISLEGYYMGVDSVIYTDHLLLAPHSSIILLRLSNPPSGKISVDAGIDTTLSFPSNAVLLNGKVVNQSKALITYAWTKVYGPDHFFLSSPDSLVTLLSNLAEGAYQFELSCKKNSSVIVRDTVTIVVKPAPASVQTIELAFEKTGDQITLGWGTNFQDSIDYFLVERSQNGHSFETLARVASKHLSEADNNYFFRDELPIDGKSFYRLKAAKVRGGYICSNAVLVTLPKHPVISIDKLFFSESTITISITSKLDKNACLIVSDVLGRRLLNEGLTLSKGSNLFKINITAGLGSLLFASVFSDGEKYTKHGIAY